MTYRPAVSCTACRNAVGFASGGGYEKLPLQYLDEDARDFPVSAPTITPIPFVPNDLVAAKADRWFPSRMMTAGFMMVLFPPMAGFNLELTGFPVKGRRAAFEDVFQ